MPLTKFSDTQGGSSSVEPNYLAGRDSIAQRFEDSNNNHGSRQKGPARRSAVERTKQKTQ